ncbi:TetR family transcriptional regulator C-terminal domain-containing protein [Roseovarius sp.]|uniref:TetR family transcriptional regulator C-terminal domain-containing protein n=1 Tax=Roseovarius sp. TaxID=1486281 RepID=UPI0026083E16|nr:TetR family transcriptional regulator C-terminal domain-containing protein [Roseovarius sp.]MDM8165762.1 TetR family transcriptional regulator C-terminal domain-containing protein [Roseovarius sp.]
MSRREKKVSERRSSLIRAAINVIAAKGLTGVTMNSIATEAKCSFGVVAFHFQSKEGVIFAALDHAAEAYEAYLAELRETSSGPADRVRSMIQADFSKRASGRASVALWVAFWAESVRVDSYRERCAEMRAHFNRMVADDLSELARQRGREIDAYQVAVSLNAMISGLWIEGIVSNEAIAKGQSQGREACLAFLRLHFPEDF